MQLCAPQKGGTTRTMLSACRKRTKHYLQTDLSQQVHMEKLLCSTQVNSLQYNILIAAMEIYVLGSVVLKMVMINPIWSRSCGG